MLVHYFIPFLAYIARETATASVIQVFNENHDRSRALVSRDPQIAPKLPGIILQGSTTLDSNTARFYDPAISTDGKDWSIPFTFKGIKFPSTSRSGGFVITIMDSQTSNLFSLTAQSLVGFTDSAYLSTDGKSLLGQAKMPTTSNSGTLFGRVNFPKKSYPNVPIISKLKVVIYYVQDDTVDKLGGYSAASLNNQICVPGSNLIRCQGGKAYEPFLPKPEWSAFSTASDVKSFGVAVLVLSSDGDNDANNAVRFVRGTYRYMINKQKVFDTVTKFSQHLKGASVRMVNKFNIKDIDTYNKPSVLTKNLNGLSFDSVQISGKTQKVISQKSLESYLIKMLNKGELKYGYDDYSILNTGTSTIVPIHLGPGVQVRTNEKEVTCEDLCAYHYTVEANARTVHYSVIPYPDKSTCPKCIIDNSEKKSVKIMASHEFFEAMAQEALGPNYIPGASEISDPCSWEAYQDKQYLTDVNKPNANVALQLMWDFETGKCVTMKDRD